MKKESDLEAGINRSFFIEEIDAGWWTALGDDNKRDFLVKFTDIREGLGFPVIANGRTILHPEDLWVFLDHAKGTVKLESPDGESELLIEAFVEGKEFSCIVIEDENGNPIALPPTEIKKPQELFDYRSKYLPGISRKITPIELPEKEIRRIRMSAEKLFKDLHSQVYARIDGFYTIKRQVILNDPNTTSGMLPSSFVFHQAAEIGLTPSQFITYIIAQSLRSRRKTGKNIFLMNSLINRLDEALKSESEQKKEKTRVAVIMGGFSSERHISVESGRNIFEKLSASDKYTPVPIFLTGDESNHLLYQLPVNIMLKDNADDIRDKVIKQSKEHVVLGEIRKSAAHIRQKYAYEGSLELEQLTYERLAERVDFAFIALHGRPGEDGAVQEHLEKLGMPYNGSGIESSRISINKYETNELLAKNGVLVAKHRLVDATQYQKNKAGLLDEIEKDYSYPFIAKPADDGCSSAVKKIKSRAELEAFCEMMFRIAL